MDQAQKSFRKDLSHSIPFRAADERSHAGRNAQPRSSPDFSSGAGRSCFLTLWFQQPGWSFLLQHLLKRGVQTALERPPHPLWKEGTAPPRPSRQALSTPRRPQGPALGGGRQGATAPPPTSPSCRRPPPPSARFPLTSISPAPLRAAPPPSLSPSPPCRSAQRGVPQN